MIWLQLFLALTIWAICGVLAAMLIDGSAWMARRRERRAIAAVRCPVCGAEPGTPCVTLYMGDCHQLRLDAAR